ncbi:MAG: copper-transporting ATPase [Isosphaera sp.]|jgi:plastocyanin domain-containing protein|nr:copper-transporting ATPase [Isosphaera sp.]
MDTAQIAVTAGGAALIGFILWFFFGPRGVTAAREGDGGVQEVEVVVQGGYTPDRIEVREGRPVRLTFLRKESNPCTEQVVIGDFGIARTLPEGERVPVEFTPRKAGEYTFHCSMNMVRGTLVVRPG